MSTALPIRPNLARNQKSNIAIVASLYNQQYTDALVEHAKSELGIIMPNSQLDVARVPGAFEIPVACELLLSKENPPQAIIALGLIIRGSTAHADLIAASITNSLQDMALRYKTPVIHEVLLVDTEQQAIDRCMGAALNRGQEAARAAYTMCELFSAISPKDTTDKTNRKF